MPHLVVILEDNLRYARSALNAVTSRDRDADVRVAHSVTEAKDQVIEAGEALPVGYVLVDLLMRADSEGAQGIDFIDWLREYLHEDDVPIFVLSSVEELIGQAKTALRGYNVTFGDRLEGFNKWRESLLPFIERARARLGLPN